MLKKLVLVLGVVTTVLGGAAILTVSTKPAYACVYCVPFDGCPPCYQMVSGSCFRCPSCKKIPGCKV